MHMVANRDEPWLDLIRIKARSGTKDDHERMNSTATACAFRESPSLWRDVIQPKEHGSWSLALEPVALGLLVAPSPAGLVLSAAVITGFLLRRPMKLAWRETSPARRTRARNVVFAGGIFALAALLTSAALSPAPLWPWMLLPALLGGVFLVCDLSNSGREAAAEVAGAGAFACVPGLFVVVGGGAPFVVIALGLTMLARALPTVWLVRLVIRSRKLGRAVPLSALLPSFAAAAFAGVAGLRGMIPTLAAVAIGALFVRAIFYCTPAARGFRARTIGFCELGFGLVFIATTSAAWLLESPQP